MNQLIEKDKIEIKDMIYNLNGVEVMLDSDLAKLYGVETKRINEAVKNNPEKFPDRFSYTITELEFCNLKSKFSTSSIDNRYGGSRKGHRVFTEQGVYMLATILKSKVAIQVSINIMDTFVNMRHYINYNKDFLPYKVLLLEDKVDKDSKRIDELFDKFNPKTITKNKIYFNDEFYQAHSFMLDLFESANEEIIIVDNYVNKELLDILKDTNKKIIVVSKNINDSLKEKYLKEYNNVTFYDNNSFHDRLIIIDRKTLYTCGASFKDLGKGGFSIQDYSDDVDKVLDNLNI